MARFRFTVHHLVEERLRFPIVIKTDNYLTEHGSYMKGRHFLAADMDHAEGILHRLEPLET